MVKKYRERKNLADQLHKVVVGYENSRAPVVAPGAERVLLHQSSTRTRNLSRARVREVLGRIFWQAPPVTVEPPEKLG
jgi:hypothetical protein